VASVEPLETVDVQKMSSIFGGAAAVVVSAVSVFSGEREEGLLQGGRAGVEARQADAAGVRQVHERRQGRLQVRAEQSDPVPCPLRGVDERGESMQVGLPDRRRVRQAE